MKTLNLVGCPILVEGIKIDSQKPAYVQGGWSHGTLPCDVKNLPPAEAGVTIIVHPHVARVLESTRPDVVAVDEAAMLKPLGICL